PENRRLARAVATHETDVLAGIVLPRDALEDIVRTVAFLDIVEPIEHCAGTQRTRGRKCSETGTRELLGDLPRLRPSEHIECAVRLHPERKLHQRRGDDAIELSHPCRRVFVDDSAA